MQNNNASLAGKLLRWCLIAVAAAVIAAAVFEILKMVLLLVVGLAMLYVLAVYVGWISGPGKKGGAQ